MKTNLLGCAMYLLAFAAIALMIWAIGPLLPPGW